MKRLLGLLIFAIFEFSHVSGAVHYAIDECLLADISASIDSQKINMTLNNVEANATGECGPEQNQSSIRVPLTDSGSMQMNFETREGSVFLTKITVKYMLNGEEQIATADYNDLLSSTDGYYVCNKTRSYQLSDTSSDPVEVKFDYLKLQAFGVKDKQYTGKVEVCSEPTTLPPTTPNTTISPAPNTTTGPTPAPSNGTTSAPANTTTAPMPTNTTTAPVPANTTTGPPTNSTTQPPAHTTTGPTNAPPPKDVVRVYVTGENNVKCIVAQFNGTLHVGYNNKSGPQNYTYPLLKSAIKNVNGTCGATRQTLIMTLDKNWQLEMVFTMVSKSSVARRLLASVKEYAMSEISLTYKVSTLPGGSGSEIVHATSNSSDRYKVTVDETYRCDSEQFFVMQNVTFVTKDLKFESFRNSTDVALSSQESECAADSSKGGSNIVPIVVGVVLVALILVIIVAYLIGRRRNRSGYQSV